MNIVELVEKVIVLKFGSQWRWPEFWPWPAAAAHDAGGGATTLRSLVMLFKM